MVYLNKLCFDLSANEPALDDHILQTNFKAVEEL
jgi:hypothetical protein